MIKVVKFILLSTLIWNSSPPACESTTSTFGTKLLAWNTLGPDILAHCEGPANYKRTRLQFYIPQQQKFVRRPFNICYTFHYIPLHTSRFIPLKGGNEKKEMKFIISSLQAPSNVSCSVINRVFTQKSSSWKPNSGQWVAWCSRRSR